MNDNELVEIKVSRLIPAPKRKLISLLIRIDEFPNYIPCVKDVSILPPRMHNIMKTKWRIEIEKIPISWIEEDIFNLKEDKIYFKAVEGDFEEFRGEWKFETRPNGTEVTVKAYLKVGVPVIKDFAEPYIKNLVSRNFEAILEAWERNVISVRYHNYKSGGNEKISGFGIIGHLYNFFHLEKTLKSLNPNFKMPSREFLDKLFHITPSFKFCDVLDFKSKTGETVNGVFLVATFIPDMIEKDIWTVFSKVVKAAKVAEKHGVGIVTLGGFTSIVAEKIGQQVAAQVDVPVTTGNTFTAAMAIEGVLRAVKNLNKDISSLNLTIIGGTGDIGSACARVLVKQVRKLTITGRTKANLKKIKSELAHNSKIKIIATTDNEKALRDADIVIAAASASSSIIDVSWFKTGAVICDVGYPKNISYAPVSRDDIFIFSGGLSKSPAVINFPIDIGLPSPDTIYGCFAEAIILALERRYENFSFGRGNITPEKIEEIKNMGAKHGFELAPFYWGDRLINGEMVK